MNCFFFLFLQFTLFRAIFLALATQPPFCNVTTSFASESLAQSAISIVIACVNLYRATRRTHERCSPTHTHTHRPIFPSSHRPIAQFPVFHTNYYLLFVVTMNRLRLHHCEFMCFSLSLYIYDHFIHASCDCFDMASVPMPMTTHRRKTIASFYFTFSNWNTHGRCFMYTFSNLWRSSAERIEVWVLSWRDLACVNDWIVSANRRNIGMNFSGSIYTLCECLAIVTGFFLLASSVC